MQSYTKFKKLINQLKNELVRLKEENVKNLALLDASENQNKNTLLKRVESFDSTSKQISPSGNTCKNSLIKTSYKATCNNVEDYRFKMTTRWSSWI